MKTLLFNADKNSAERLEKLKKEFGLSYTEALKRGLFALEKELVENESAIELGKAYQESLMKKRGKK